MSNPFWKLNVMRLTLITEGTLLEVAGLCAIVVERDDWGAKRRGGEGKERGCSAGNHNRTQHVVEMV